MSCRSSTVPTCYFFVCKHDPRRSSHMHPAVQMVECSFVAFWHGALFWKFIKAETKTKTLHTAFNKEEKGKFLLSISSKKMTRAEKRDREAKSMQRVGGVCFRKDFLISGKKEMCVKGRSEKVWGLTLKGECHQHKTVLSVNSGTLFPLKSSGYRRHKVISVLWSYFK